MMTRMSMVVSSPVNRCSVCKNFVICNVILISHREFINGMDGG